MKQAIFVGLIVLLPIPLQAKTQVQEPIARELHVLHELAYDFIECESARDGQFEVIQIERIRERQYFIQVDDFLCVSVRPERPGQVRPSG